MAGKAALWSSMSQITLKKTALCATGEIVLLLAFVGLLFAVEQRRTQAETGAVLSAFFCQEVLHDMDQSRPGSTVEIVIQRHPGCRFCEEVTDIYVESWFARSLKLRGSTLSDPWFARSSRITRASFFLNSVFSTDISTDLHLPTGARAVFVDPSDLMIYRGDLGFFVVSHVGLNLNKSESLFYFDHLCAGLCGGGGYVLMRKANGVWRVVDRHITWVS